MRKRLKILFVIRALATFHYYKSILEALCSRGHRVHVIFDYKRSRAASPDQVELFKKDKENFSYELLPSRTNLWKWLIFPAREILSYRRYLLVRGQSDYYRKRWIKWMPSYLRPLMQCQFVNVFLETKLAGGLLKFIERMTPPVKSIVKKIREYGPDAVVVSPANSRYSTADIEYLKAAKKLHIPTAVQVISWDNLTTKGIFHIIPDVVLAWNEAQVREAQEHHGVAPEKIKITGAPFFDGWFSKLEPSCPKTEFCLRHGLRKADPIILYLGSSANIARDEVWLIKSLLVVLASSLNKEAKRAQFVVRPHPANYKIFENLERENLKIFPKTGSLPDNADNLQLFYDTLHYSALTVGINTSAMIDAIIANKPGIAIMVDEYRSTQLETQHFRYFLDHNVLASANGPAEFEKIVVNILEGKDERKENRKDFVEEFVRPRGVNNSAGEMVAVEIENLVVRKKHV